MIKPYGRPVGCQVAVFTGRGGPRVICRPSLGDDPVVTIRTFPHGRRMIEPHSAPACRQVAGFAFRRGIGMGPRLSPGRGAIVAADTAGRDKTVIEGEWFPVVCGVALGTRFARRRVAGRTAFCKFVVVATDTGGRRIVKLPSDMACFACKWRMCARQRETGRFVIESGRSGGLRGGDARNQQEQHQRNDRKYQKQKCRQKRRLGRFGGLFTATTACGSLQNANLFSRPQQPKSNPQAVVTIK